MCIKSNNWATKYMNPYQTELRGYKEKFINIAGELINTSHNWLNSKCKINVGIEDPNNKSY